MQNRLRKFGSELVDTSLLVPLILATYLGHALDVLTTWYALRCGAHEGNPFIAWLVESEWRGKWVALSGLKILVLNDSAKTVMQWRMVKFEAWQCLFVWAVVLWNCSVIFRRRRAIPA